MFVDNVKKVEMSPVWQQRKLRELCKSKGIVVTAYSVLGSRGAFWGTHKIMESDVLKEIAEAKGKTVAQVLSKDSFKIIYENIFKFLLTYKY